MPILPDDLCVGTFVASTQPVKQYDPGTPLYICCISLPFIAVKAVTPDGIDELIPLHITPNLYKLTSEYINEFLPPPTTSNLSVLRGSPVSPTQLPDPHEYPTPSAQ